MNLLMRYCAIIGMKIVIYITHSKIVLNYLQKDFNR